MRILKIMDGFITNSSSSSNTIVLALRKGVKLEEMLEMLGLSSEYASRFDREHSSVTKRLKWKIDDGYLDANIYDLQQEYDILIARIITYGFGDWVDDVDHSDFR